MRAAAAALSTSASAISHRLTEAERRLGGSLFTRGPGRTVRPTTIGLAIAQRASGALDELNRSEAEFMAAAGSALSVVRVGVGGYDAYHWFTDFLQTVERSGIPVSVDLVAVGDSPASRLASGEVDIVVAQGIPEGPIETRPLFNDELGLVTHPTHPLAKRGFVEPADLTKERYLSYSRTAWPGFEYDRFVRPAGQQPLVVTVIERTSIIVEMVASGSAVSILSRWALEPAITAGRIAWTRCSQTGDCHWAGIVSPGQMTEPLT